MQTVSFGGKEWRLLYNEKMRILEGCEPLSIIQDDKKEKVLIRAISSCVVVVLIGLYLVFVPIKIMPPIYGIFCGVEFWAMIIFIYSFAEYFTTNKDD